MYDIFCELGITPEEWGEMGIVHQQFVKSAHGERADRQDNQ